MTLAEFISNQIWDLKYQMLQAFCGVSDDELRSASDGHWPIAWHVLHCMNLADFMINVQLTGVYHLELDEVYRQWPLVEPRSDWVYPSSVELQRRWVLLIDGILDSLGSISEQELQNASGTAYNREPLVESVLRVINHTHAHIRSIVALIYSRNGNHELPDQGIWMPDRRVVGPLLEDLNRGLRSAGNSQSPMVRRLAKTYFPQISHHDMWTILENCEDLMSRRNTWVQMIVCAWMERLQGRLRKDHFFHFERWLYLYVGTWGQCDDYCKRIANPLLRRYPDLLERILGQWTTASSVWVRRASAVSLIRSGQGTYICDFDVEGVLAVADALIDDKEMYVKKALGWLLRSASLCHREDIVSYLALRGTDLPRQSFRRAMEHLDATTREKLRRSST